MLSKPHNGWVDFQLDGTKKYYISCLAGVPESWLDAAILGLENLLPFCLYGNMEPARFHCVVSYWNCHIICDRSECLEFDDNGNIIETDSNKPLREFITNECVEISMLRFCKLLHDDIVKHMEEWKTENYFKCDIPKMEKKLSKLEELITSRTSDFNEQTDFIGF